MRDLLPIVREPEFSAHGLLRLANVHKGYGDKVRTLKKRRGIRLYRYMLRGSTTDRKLRKILSNQLAEEKYRQRMREKQTHESDQC